jgi:hypothetical protein
VDGFDSGGVLDLDPIGVDFPTDSGLIGDGVRVIPRLLRRAKTSLGQASSGLK